MGKLTLCIQFGIVQILCFGQYIEGHIVGCLTISLGIVFQTMLADKHGNYCNLVNADLSHARYLVGYGSLRN